MGATTGRRRHLGQALTAAHARRLLRANANPTRAAVSRRFFKTGKGQYGEGDRFLGVTVPDIRVVARSCRELSAPEVTRLLRYAYHEERLLAVFILIEQFQKGDARKRMRIFRLYMRNRKWINNWDLVDVSAPYIVGPQLEHADRSLLYDLARSRGLWDRRIAVLTTLYFIRQGEYGDSIALCTRLLNDSEDLIHKACGWMLREIGKRDRRVLERFLDRHAAVMPRTMLRYAVERLPATSRRIHMAARAHGR